MANGIALVTGANGFVGSHLCQNLLANGYHVRGLVRATSNLQFIEKLNLELIYGDISNPLSLPPAVSGVDYIFHPAGLVRARNRETFFRVNQVGTRNLVESVLKHNTNLKRLVHISSQAAAGPSDSLKPKTESDPPNPVSAYGDSKLASENEVLESKDKIPVTIIRPPAVYGPRDIDIYKFYKIAKLGINPRLGVEPHYVSLVHVADLVECIRMAAENDKAAGQTFFAANRDYYDIDHLIGIMADCMNSKTVDIAIPVGVARCLAFTIEKIFELLNKMPPLSRDKLNELAQKYWICSSDKAANLLGWTASVPIKKGIEETYKWYKENRWL
jgi:nucleoside-diphosphate-sugar epimerase